MIAFSNSLSNKLKPIKLPVNINLKKANKLLLALKLQKTNYKPLLPLKKASSSTFLLIIFSLASKLFT